MEATETNDLLVLVPVGRKHLHDRSVYSDYHNDWNSMNGSLLQQNSCFYHKKCVCCRLSNGVDCVLPVLIIGTLIGLLSISIGVVRASMKLATSCFSF